MQMSATAATVNASFFSRSVDLPSKYFSIAGVRMLTSRIEKTTPSGREALKRIRAVRKAARIAKTIFPARVFGFVTGSVSMKTAPKAAPPVKTMNSAYSRAMPLKAPMIRAEMNSVPR